MPKKLDQVILKFWKGESVSDELIAQACVGTPWTPEKLAQLREDTRGAEGKRSRLELLCPTGSGKHR